MKCGDTLSYNITEVNGDQSAEYYATDASLIYENGQSTSDILTFDIPSKTINVTIAESSSIEGTQRTRIRSCDASTGSLYESYLSINVNLCPFLSDGAISLSSFASVMTSVWLISYMF